MKFAPVFGAVQEEIEFPGFTEFDEALPEAAVINQEVDQDYDDNEDVFFDACSAAGSIRSERAAVDNVVNDAAPIMPRRDRQGDVHRLQTIDFVSWNTLPLQVISRLVASFVADVRGSRKTKVYLRPCRELFLTVKQLEEVPNSIWLTCSIFLERAPRLAFCCPLPVVLANLDDPKPIPRIFRLKIVFSSGDPEVKDHLLFKIYFLDDLHRSTFQLS